MLLAAVMGSACSPVCLSVCRVVVWSPGMGFDALVVIDSVVDIVQSQVVSSLMCLKTDFISFLTSVSLVCFSHLRVSGWMESWRQTVF